ncbi:MULTISPECIES: dihydrodipicolinate reductase [Actinomycetes]|uniref:NAD(P)H-dependent amine dehydrogenase family protein n=1 Tax=Actinomycetes TaxID=1760 RepID=UPI0004C0FE1F|nr:MULTISPECIES: dihydrodipicolinate reductase [Actinomycetes]
MPDAAERKTRVIQWATGAVGVEALRGILDHPDLELAGVRVYSSDKHGVDAGVLAGRSKVGLAATTSVDEVLQSDADCVLYTPRSPSIDDVCSLLASGKNVVTTSFGFHNARADGPDKDRLRKACEAGGTSLHGTGLNPGNLGVVLPLALSGLTRDITNVKIQERADWAVYESLDITFDQMRFGSPVGEVTPECESLKFTSDLFREQVWLVGDALGLDLDEVVTDLQVIPASVDHEVFGRTLKAGTVAGQWWRWTGRSAGHIRVEVEAVWTVGERPPSGWPAPQHGWTITLEGTPSAQAHIVTLASFVRDASLAEHVNAASIATAAQAVNSVTAVVAAPPGFVTIADLPLIRNRHAVARAS